MNFRLKDGRATAWQWDQDVVLILDGVADGTEIHLGYSATSVLKKTVENGELVVPNILLTRNRDIPIFIYDGENTTDSALLEVVGRPKPPDYIYTEPEKLTWELLEERIDNLSASLDNQREMIETVGNNSLPFVISVTGKNEAYTADKTYAEIMAAYNSGRRIVCVLNAKVPVDNGETYIAEGAQVPLHTVLDDGTLICQHGTVNPYGMSLEVTFMPDNLISAICFVVGGKGEPGEPGGSDTPAIDLSDYAKLSDIAGVAYLDTEDNAEVEVPEFPGGSCTCEAPSIGENGNWFIGDVDTGVRAAGLTPSIGENGNWFIGDTDTGIYAGGIKVTGAEAGQIVKIAAVDENGIPTAWEAADTVNATLLASWTLEETGIAKATIPLTHDPLTFSTILITLSGTQGASDPQQYLTLVGNEKQCRVAHFNTVFSANSTATARVMTTVFKDGVFSVGHKSPTYFWQISTFLAMGYPFTWVSGTPALEISGLNQFTALTITIEGV